MIQYSSIPNELPAEGDASLDVMADLAASDEFDLELVAVSTDSIPVHRWWASEHNSEDHSGFVRVWRERREGGGPMIMLADRTGEVPSFASLQTC